MAAKQMSEFRAEQQLVALLGQKRDKLLEIERVTDWMYSLEVEELEVCMEQRSALFADIDALDRSMAGLCGDDRELAEALHQGRPKETFAPALQQVYDAALSVRAVGYRLLQNIEGVRLHLESEKQRIADKMEEINNSASSVADQYYRSVQTGTRRQFGTEFGRKI